MENTVLPKSEKVKSLLHMISNDIAQLAYLYAQVNSCTKIIFGGFFIRGHAATMHTISFGVNYWSKVRRRVKSFDALLQAELLSGHF